MDYVKIEVHSRKNEFRIIDWEVGEKWMGEELRKLFK